MNEEEVLSKGWDGWFNGSGSAGAHIWLWTKAWQNKLSNYTKIQYTLCIQRDQSYCTTYGNFQWRILDDTGHSGSYNMSNIGVGSSIELMTKTVVYQHNSDGTIATINFDADVLAPTSSLNLAVVSGSYTPPTIPRTSKINSITATNIEDSLSVDVTKNSSSFNDDLYIKYGSDDIKTISNYTTNTSISFTNNEILNLYEKIDSNNKVNLTFVINTMSDSTLIGSVTSTKELTAKGTLNTLASGSIKKCIPIISVNGSIKKCIAFTNVNGTIKRGN